MTYSLRSYYEKQSSSRPLFFDFTKWRFFCKMSGGNQSESLAVFIGIGIKSILCEIKFFFYNL